MARQNTSDFGPLEPVDLADGHSWDTEQRQIDEYLGEIFRLMSGNELSDLDCEVISVRVKLLTFLIDSYLLREEGLLDLTSAPMLVMGQQERATIRALHGDVRALHRRGAEVAAQFEAMQRLRKALRLYFVSTNEWHNAIFWRKA